MKQLQEKIGYTYKNPALLRHALTHSSYANESRDRLSSNERLEFLGDSVLGIVSAEYLYHYFPNLPEGELTKRRAALVCEGSLYEVARSLGLGRCLRLGKGEAAGGVEKYVFAQLLHALLPPRYTKGRIRSSMAFTSSGFT